MNYQILGFFMIFLILSGCQEQERALLPLFESDFVYPLEKRDSLDWKLESMELFFYKMDPTVSTAAADEYLSSYFFQNIKEGRILVRSDDQIGTVDSLDIRENLLLRDTDIIETIFEISSLITANDVYRYWEKYKIKQAWRYDENTGMLHSSVQEVTPILRNKKGKWLESFSIPNDQNSISVKSVKEILNNKDNIWVSETRHFLNLNTINFSDEVSGNLLKKIFWEDVLSNKVAVEKKNYQGNFEVFNPQELLTSIVDTVITFDPVTYDEKIQVYVRNPVVFEDILGYKISQLWYFNNRTLKLNSKVIAVEPMVKDHIHGQLQSLFTLRE